MEEKFIQFVAKYDDWIAVRKLKIEEKTDPIVVAEFLAGLTNSVDSKVGENLKKILNLSELDKVLESLEYGKSEQEISQVLAHINSGKINKLINAAIDLLPEEKFQKNQKKELTDFCKVYAMKTALKKCGLMSDYSSIEIPGMKKLSKKGGKE